ncbi:MAG: hypothetical protein GWP06_06110 [Actinobacteria bacterium]|nr:hypothetical protein [Actinomycetota bacterium]
MEKIKIWKCTECGIDYDCLRGFVGNELLPANQVNCNLCKKPDIKPAWKKTEGFEIRKKTIKEVEGLSISEDESCEKCGMPKLKIDYPKLAAIFETQTPNCEICKWKIDGTRPDQDDHNHLNLFYMCAAQGLEYADECYNSIECKALFESKEPEHVFKSKDEAKQFIKDRVEPYFGDKVLTAEQFTEQRTSGTLWNLCKVSFDTFRGLLIEFFNTGKENSKLEMSQDIESSVVLLKSISDSMFSSGETRFAPQISGIAENIRALQTKKEK